MRLAARDLAPRVRVNAIAVGSVATSALEIVTGDEGLTAQMEANTPLRRIGDPDDIAATVLFLASPAGAYLTGKVLEEEAANLQRLMDETGAPAWPPDPASDGPSKVLPR